MDVLLDDPRVLIVQTIDVEIEDTRESLGRGMEMNGEKLLVEPRNMQKLVLQSKRSDYDISGVLLLEIKTAAEIPYAAEHTNSSLILAHQSFW